MVAEHGKDAEAGGQPGERLGRRLHEPVIAVGHVVAADDDEVGLVGHDEVDRPGDHLVGDGRAAMQIGEEPDAKAGERRGPAGDVERLLGQLDVVALVKEPVGRGARHRAQCDRSQPLQQRAPRQPGRLGNGEGMRNVSAPASALRAVGEAFALRARRSRAAKPEPANLIAIPDSSRFVHDPEQ